MPLPENGAAESLGLGQRRDHVARHFHHVDLAVHDHVGRAGRLVDESAQAMAVDALDDDLGKLLGSEDGRSPEARDGAVCSPHRRRQVLEMVPATGFEPVAP